ncbi:MAG: four helix bundle protein [Cyclobacteriaceae bacterium]
MHQFKELLIWQRGMDLVKTIYNLTKQLPDSEKFGLVSQINRSAVSVPSNIAEGSSRKSEKEFSHFLRIALGSLYELETQIILVKNLEFVIEQKIENVLKEIEEIKKMIKSFHYKIASL